jgi:hypothetical protein
MDPIVKLVALRWKLASDPTWLGDAEELDLDSALGYFRDDTRLIKGYKAKCAYLSSVYRTLVSPLESSILVKYADLMDKRVTEVNQLMILLGEGVKLLKRAQGEFEKLMVSLANGEPHRGDLIKMVYDLPTIVAIMKIANEAGKLHDKLTKEDDDGLVDWTLEEYIGSEAGIQRKIEKAGEPMQGWFAGGSNFVGAGALYGFVKYLADPEYIQSNINEIRAKREATN